MVPGIHNLSSVGSSPLKRGAVKLAEKREIQYINQGSAAGAVSSKVSLNKVILPAMDREMKYNYSQPNLDYTPNTRNAVNSKRVNLTEVK